MAQASTQEFVPIKNIKGNVVVEKHGQMCMVLLASSINFALKSVPEQEAILQQFQSFLNTLEFSLQIYIQSRRLNIEPYLNLLTSLEKKQDGELMRTQLREYIEFIRTFTENVDVMSKNFFVVVPYTPSKLNITNSFTNFLSPKTFSKSTVSDSPMDQDFEEQRAQLEQRVSLVAEGISRVGIRTVTLEKEDLIDFYYHVYNPADITGAAMPIKQ